MNSIHFDSRFARSFFKSFNFEAEVAKTFEAFSNLKNRKGAGNEFLGWMELPKSIPDNLLTDINESAYRFRSQSRYLVVVGIGGSYLGARAVIEALSDPFHDPGSDKNSIFVLYAGHNLDSTYHQRLIQFLEDKDFSVNVISKSGTTTEPAIAFRLLWNLLVKKYGKKEAAARVVATTDEKRGALKSFASEHNIKSYVIPDDVGGRYSVLTPVGLLPIATKGISIRDLVLGAQASQDEFFDSSGFSANPMLEYVTARNLLYSLGKKMEVLVTYNSQLRYLAEWWKQLFGESEGKGGKGIFPASVELTTDLHSLGQYLQDGERVLFETVLTVKNPRLDISLPESESDLDGLNYLAGKNLSWVESQAIAGTLVAHSEGKVPCLELEIPELNAYSLGYLLYFFELSCGTSGYRLGVNPFDQPGVEDYKQNMFALLGKSGFESRKKEIQEMLKNINSL